MVECQKICRENSDCDHFRYRDGKTLCVLLKTDMKAFQRKYCRDIDTFVVYGNIHYMSLDLPGVAKQLANFGSI